MSDDLKEQNKQTVSSSTSESTSATLISNPLAKPIKPTPRKPPTSNTETTLGLDGYSASLSAFYAKTYPSSQVSVLKPSIPQIPPKPIPLLPPQQQEPSFLSSSSYPTMQTSTPTSLISLSISPPKQLSYLETAPVESKQPMKKFADKLSDYGYQKKHISLIHTMCTTQEVTKPNLEKKLTNALIKYRIEIDHWEQKGVISKDHIIRIIVNSENPKNVAALLKYLPTIHQDLNRGKRDEYYSSDDLVSILRFQEGNKTLKFLAENHDKYIAYFKTCKRIVHIAGIGWGLNNIVAIGPDPGRLDTLKFRLNWVLATLRENTGGSSKLLTAIAKKEKELENTPVQVENKRKRKATTSSSVFPQPTPSNQFTGIYPPLGSNPLHDMQRQPAYFPFFTPHPPVLPNVSPIDEAKLVTATNPNLFIEKPGGK